MLGFSENRLIGTLCAAEDQKDSFLVEDLLRRLPDEKEKTMNNHKTNMRKSLKWAGIAYGVFTALSVIGPIVLDRLWSRPRQ